MDVSTARGYDDSYPSGGGGRARVRTRSVGRAVVRRSRCLLDATRGRSEVPPQADSKPQRRLEVALTYVKLCTEH